MKGIILAGGSGTRLYPVTQAGSKQLLPIYDKPMIYYPLSVLMLGGIREILIITTPVDLPRFKSLLGTGKQWGISLHYEVQEEPKGLAEAFIIGEDFINGGSCTLILGDNFLHGHDLQPLIQKSIRNNKGATVFAYRVQSASNYGVIEFDENFNAISIEEKPEVPKSNYAVIGLYIFDEQVVSFAKKLIPSSRGELEITDLNNMYLHKNQLQVQLFGRGMAWLDTGTHNDLLEAGQFVATLERRQGQKIACLEEIAYRMGFVDDKKFVEIIKKYGQTDYGQYLQSLRK